MNNLPNIEQSLLKLMKEEPQELEKVLPALAAIPAAIAAGALKLGAGALAAGGKIAAGAGKAAAGAGRGAATVGRGVQGAARANAMRNYVSEQRSGQAAAEPPPDYDPETEDIMPIAASIKKLMKAQPMSSQWKTNTMRGQQFGGSSPIKWGMGAGKRQPTMGGGGSSSPFGTAAEQSAASLASPSSISEAKGTAAAEGLADRLGAKAGRAGARALYGPEPEAPPMKVEIVDPNEEKSIENALTPPYADDSSSTESSALEKSLLKLMKDTYKVPPKDLFRRGLKGDYPESLGADNRNIGPIGGTQGSALDWDRKPQSDQNPINMPKLTRGSPPPFGTKHNPRGASMYMRNSIEKALLKLMKQKEDEQVNLSHRPKGSREVREDTPTAGQRAQDMGASGRRFAPKGSVFSQEEMDQLAADDKKQRRTYPQWSEADEQYFLDKDYEEEGILNSLSKLMK